MLKKINTPSKKSNYHIVDNIFQEGNQKKFDCLKELNDFLIKEGWEDVGEMYFTNDNYKFNIFLSGIKKMDGEYYPIMHFSYKKEYTTNYKKDNKKLQEDIREYLKEIGYGRIIDEDTQNGFLYNSYYILDKYLSIKIIANKKGNEFKNHELDGDTDIGKIRRIVSVLKKEGINYLDDVL